MPATKRGNTYYVDVMHLEGVAVEMGATGHAAEAVQPGSLRAWLEELEQWKSGLAITTSQTASDLVIEDRHARR
jgi:hypothetical protein